MKLPKDWSEITIAQFIEITNILNDNKDNNIQAMIFIMACLSGKSNQEIEAIEIDRFTGYTKDLAFLNQDKFKDQIINSFEIDGIKYIPKYKFNKLTAGQFIDIHSLAADINNIHKLLAVVCMPKGAEHEDVAEIFYNNLTMDKAYPIFLFFCVVLEIYLKATKDYLERLIKKEKKELSKMARKAKTPSTIVGRGLSYLMN